MGPLHSQVSQSQRCDHNVHIVYGKNLTDFKMEKSIENTITGVHPYWVDNETQAVMELPEKVVMVSRKSVPYQKITVLDCTSAFQEKAIGSGFARVCTGLY